MEKRQASSARGGRTNDYNRARRQFGSRLHTPVRSANGQLGAQEPSQLGSINSPFMQQVMPAIYLGLSWRQMFWSLFIVALVNAGLVYLCFKHWIATIDIAISYTDCVSSGKSSSAVQKCNLTFDVPEKIRAPVYVYYELCNVYINRRSIQVSWSLPQIRGTPTEKLEQSCAKFTYRDNKQILPCGALPNSMFNDTLNITGPLQSNGSEGSPVALSSSNMSWPSHKASLHVALPAKLLENKAKPDNWPWPAEQRYARPFADSDDLWIWLTTPAFSCFRKMMHRVELTDGLQAGKYRLSLDYNYPVLDFGGAKSIIVANKSVLGGKNLALPILSAITSCVYLLLSLSVLLEINFRLRNKSRILGFVLNSQS